MRSRGMERGRPYSFTDSFLICSASERALSELVGGGTRELKDASTQTEEPVGQSWIYQQTLSFIFHVGLIGVFETVFFFFFISDSENGALQKMLGGYLSGILTDCGSWNATTTEIVNDVLQLFINTTTVAQECTVAAQAREMRNRALQIRAWMYVVGLAAAFMATGAGFHVCRRGINYRRILLENVIMVSLLGCYEVLFFKTVIYHYETMALPELNEFVVEQLQKVCGLLRNGNSA